MQSFYQNGVFLRSKPTMPVKLSVECANFEYNKQKNQQN